MSSLVSGIHRGTDEYESTGTVYMFLLCGNVCAFTVYMFRHPFSYKQIPQSGKHQVHLKFSTWTLRDDIKNPVVGDDLHAKFMSFTRSYTPADVYE